MKKFTITDPYKEIRKMENKVKTIAGLGDNVPTQSKRAELRKKRKNKKK